MQAHCLPAVFPNSAMLPWLKLSWTDFMISYGSGFNSTSPESFQVLVILTFKSYKFNFAVNTTSKRTKTAIPKNN